MTQPCQLPPNWLRFTIVILLVLGTFFRFVNLNQKTYWEDETYTSLRSSGYTVEEVVQQVFDSRVISIQDLQKYQHPTPEKGLADTIKALVEHPEHPPLYYVMARFWMQLFNDVVTTPRSLSALISLLVLPCVYWLCLELFESSMVGWVAVALVAVSPICIRYAQEARQYSLWIVMILLSSVALLRAIRLKTKFTWIAYSVIVALSLYCHLFSGLVLMGHGLYVLALERFRLTKTLTAYLLASSFGLLAFTPWVGVIITNNNRLFGATDWLKSQLPFLSLVRAWSFNLCRIFISWNQEFNNFLIYSVIPILIFVVYSIYFLCNHTPKKIWLFILTLIGVTSLALVLPDLILGGQRSRIAQYLFPCYLGIQLAVAYLLASKIISKSASSRRLKVWQIVMTLLISGGVLSCAINSQADTWWGWSEFDVQISRIVNQTNHPLVISDERLTQILPLSHGFEPKVRLLLVSKPNIPKIPEGFSNVFLFNPSERLRSELEQQQNIKSVLVYQFRENLLVVSLFCADTLKNHQCQEKFVDFN